MSSWPAASSVALTSASPAAGSARSALATKARSPSSPASASSAGRRVPASTTLAPAPWSARAMAPPMPPEAPVTRALLPPRSNMLRSFPRRRSEGLEESFDLGGSAERGCRKLAVDAFGEAAQHAAGAELDQLVDALLLHVEHALAPAHETGDLLDE